KKEAAEARSPVPSRRFTKWRRGNSGNVDGAVALASGPEDIEILSLFAELSDVLHQPIHLFRREGLVGRHLAFAVGDGLLQVAVRLLLNFRRFVALDAELLTHWVSRAVRPVAHGAFGLEEGRAIRCVRETIDAN